MKNYIQADEWNIIEEGFDPHLNKISESIFSLGNGHMGQRANFEEAYSGETLQGNYVAGVYYPDKTRVGWWKNGYPEYFAKVLNAANWIGIDIVIDGIQLDLSQCKVISFKRVLNMQQGYLERFFVAELSNGNQVSVAAKRFCSIVDEEAGAIRYSITPLNFSGEVKIMPFIDGDVSNYDANYDEKFWDHVDQQAAGLDTYLMLETRKTNFVVCTGSRFAVHQNGQLVAVEAQPILKDKYVASVFTLNLVQGQETVIYKYAANVSSQNYAPEDLPGACKAVIDRVAAKGFETMLQEQADAWQKKWDESDIVIEGDVSAQQGIRFNIFQLSQTYTGKDARLNIGPKGFTGEKYGGSTYWDTEAYCVPFYLATAPQQVTKNLLVYRYNQLGKAIENATKLGFNKGAALYPMVTMNGEECHNEWEITFEEIHRNGAIAYAIFNYIRYTGDQDYLVDYGLEVLIGIARFWKQRVNWSNAKKQYVMLGVTGPNEYENNINNNWYTSTLATWCMGYAIEALNYVKAQAADKCQALLGRLNFNEADETGAWQHIIDNMYYAEDKEHGIYLQQDGFLDKEIIHVKDLDPSQRPLNQKWSWDRILRSCFIKQADVLQGFYFFRDQYDIDTLRRNYNFYEPLTVHESSLSPCIHAILASRLDLADDAYNFYLRTSRLDLDDYNNDTEDGLHITSMAGTWMSVVEGFAGMHVQDDTLKFEPFLPAKWKSFSFNVGFRKNTLNVKIVADGVRITNLSGSALSVNVFDKPVLIEAGAEAFVVR
ncbi:glycoside hydrolase family 65 protein [Mucilaginibacter paludis]|uniref:Glycoside hydrolase family 65 central catalytic n=1 Tax=Mucilaginibacter paludis DSM 18603 TaxID=714943 RepID=H1Y2X6_9SPHI|nr:glycoside hydrolase family 65 protein [Mucilaginibacter paludis]EHQ28521.1 glycoside hydrolase family 65 central catalytic [Mucilaginibacter paludis DSM 18603]